MKIPNVIKRLADWLDKPGWYGMEWGVWVGFGFALGIIINVWLIWHLPK